MTPEQHRDHAELVMREYLLDLHDITEVKDYLGRSLPSEDAATVVALIRTANVEITWPDPCPACGVVGCTQHPTWAAEPKPEPAPAAFSVTGPDLNGPRATCKAQYVRPGGRQRGDRIVECDLFATHSGDHCETATGHHWERELPEWELPEWERELLARQAAEAGVVADPPEPAITWTPAKPGDTPGALPPWAGLTPAQEIRLRIVESLTCPESDESDVILNIAERLAEWVETGERDDEEDQEPEPARYPMDTAALQEWGKAVTRKFDEAWGRMRPDPSMPEVEKLREQLAQADAEGAVSRKRVILLEERRERIRHFAEHLEDEFPTADVELLGDLRHELYEAIRLVPHPAGYSETLHIPGTDDAVVLTPGGFEPVVTAQDPGGLLSEPEAPVAALPVVTPNDTPGSVDDPL